MADFLDRLGEELVRVARTPLGLAEAPSTNGHVPDFLERLEMELVRVAGLHEPVHVPSPPARMPGRPWRMPSRRLVLAVVLALLVAAGIATAAGIIRWSPGPVPPGAGSPAVTSVEPQLASHFAIFRRARTAADEIPSTVRFAFSGASGANIELARNVQGLDEGQAWVVPGRGHICLLAGLSVGNPIAEYCSGLDTALGGRSLTYHLDGSSGTGSLLVGLVPDGVGSVMAHLTDGTSAALPVHEGVYLTRSSDVTAVSFQGPSGPVSVEVSSPGSPRRR